MSKPPRAAGFICLSSFGEDGRCTSVEYGTYAVHNYSTVTSSYIPSTTHSLLAPLSTADAQLHQYTILFSRILATTYI